MDWFSNGPDVIRVGRKNFLVAGEAIAHWEAQIKGPMRDQGGSGPFPDWPATSFLILARPQLDQAVEILQSAFSIDARLFSGSEVSRLLHDLILAVPGGEQAAQDFAFELNVVGEGVDLWRALHEASSLYVQHSYEYGSISITTGPELPDLGALGMRASDGELDVDPASVFSAATACTSCAAELAVRLEVWRTEGYDPERADGESRP